MHKLIDELTKRLEAIEKEDIHKQLEVLIKDVEYIELFLNNRTRGFYGRSKSR